MNQFAFNDVQYNLFTKELHAIPFKIIECVMETLQIALSIYDFDKEVGMGQGKIKMWES